MAPQRVELPAGVQVSSLPDGSVVMYVPCGHACAHLNGVALTSQQCSQLAADLIRRGIASALVKGA